MNKKKLNEYKVAPNFALGGESDFEGLYQAALAGNLFGEKTPQKEWRGTNPNTIKISASMSQSPWTVDEKDSEI